MGKRDKDVARCLFGSSAVFLDESCDGELVAIPTMTKCCNGLHEMTKPHPKRIGLATHWKLVLGRKISTFEEARDDVFRSVLISIPARKRISKQHAIIQCIERSPGDFKWTIGDLGSVNGVYVNCAKIPVGEPVKLKHGDRIDLGDPGYGSAAYMVVSRKLGGNKLAQQGQVEEMQAEEETKVEEIQAEKKTKVDEVQAQGRIEIEEIQEGEEESKEEDECMNQNEACEEVCQEKHEELSFDISPEKKQEDEKSTSSNKSKANAVAPQDDDDDERVNSNQEDVEKTQRCEDDDELDRTQTMLTMNPLEHAVVPNVDKKRKLSSENEAMFGSFVDRSSSPESPCGWNTRNAQGTAIKRQKLMTKLFKFVW